MRTAGVLLISLIPVLLGAEYKSLIKRRKEFFATFREFITFVKEQIRFFARERDEIFTLALNDARFNENAFSIVLKCFKNGQDLKKILKYNIDIRLNQDEINLIDAFIFNIGKSDTEGQLNHCDFYIAQFDGILKKHEAAYTVKSRLSGGLSASLAAVLFILMI